MDQRFGLSLGRRAFSPTSFPSGLGNVRFYPYKGDSLAGSRLDRQLEHVSSSHDKWLREFSRVLWSRQEPFCNSPAGDFVGATPNRWNSWCHPGDSWFALYLGVNECVVREAEGFTLFLHPFDSLLVEESIKVRSGSSSKDGYDPRTHISDRISQSLQSGKCHNL